MFRPADLDLKSLALHRLVVQKIKQQPTLFGRAQETINRWKGRVDGASLPRLMDWQGLINQGMDGALSAAIEDSERGRLLRQSSPFTRILSQKERGDFLRSWSSIAGSDNR